MPLASLRPESLVIFQVQSLSVPLNEHGSLTSPRTSLDLNFDFQTTRLPFSGSLQSYWILSDSSSVLTTFPDEIPAEKLHRDNSRETRAGSHSISSEPLLQPPAQSLFPETRAITDSARKAEYTDNHQVFRSNFPAAFLRRFPPGFVKRNPALPTETALPQGNSSAAQMTQMTQMGAQMTQMNYVKAVLILC